MGLGKWTSLLQRRSSLPSSPLKGVCSNGWSFGVANAPALFQELINKVPYKLRRRSIVQIVQIEEMGFVD